MTKREREQLAQLRNVVWICLNQIAEDDPKEICNRTGLSLSTVRRLQKEEFTTAVHYGTIQRLAAAGGVELSVTEGSRILVNV